MAPRARRGEAAAEPQAFHELGVRGRKTGVFLPDGGERDEHGMQPLDAIFSSPNKAAASTNGVEDSSGSEDMDIASSAGPGPRTLLKNQRSLKFPLPRSRSPAKTNLASPARKNPLVGQLSSLARRSAAEDRDVTVTRKLDFDAKTARSAAGSARAKTNGVNGKRRANVQEDGGDDDDEVLGDSAHINFDEMVEQSIQMVDAMGGDDEDPPFSPRGAPDEEDRDNRSDEDAPAVSPIARRPPPHSERKESKKRRSLRSSAGGTGHTESPPPAELQEEDEEPRRHKRQRIQPPPGPPAAAPSAKRAAPAVAASKAKAKAKAIPINGGKPNTMKKAKSQGQPLARKTKAQIAKSDAALDTGEASFVALQRGPPLPKSRGLVTVRGGGETMTQTRSGRHSFKPVEYWRGEQIIREEEEQADMFYKDDFVLPTIKEVVRVERELPPPPKRATRGKGRPPSKAKQRQNTIVEDDEELEEWEYNPGTVTGEIVLWEPEHEQEPPADDEPVQVMDDRIAISADAIQTSDIKDATFRFAKTLTMPFMGAGVVDLPPGAEKRPKNSRKMHMVFFVHYGKVLVTINEAQFRISAGGTWFVPRGNFYSITNDYDNPSRIFFAQACEIMAPRPDEAEEEPTVPLAY
ncbi:hypothetical protein DCS_02420 [Drechmeria coniospora]|uniref:CENP-C homolog n=1 Tax=Drechmeria coniospora TaxID=98403 RepID=A0A151GW00_DRECN|nr:hypothetical protein DCS_02420 [Drechmeria coniospora]KYK61278.1 hypothetical protein DCS_02420 [Drechmeria coniospora]ODA81042.1 hypothetical protein RJ55_04004 [Drechmeria coniospora]